MNKTKIEWTDYTWNPVTGCLRGCPYCYAHSIVKRFPKAFPNVFDPTFYPDRLREPERVKKPSKIFTVSMGDLFGHWVDGEWVCKVLNEANFCQDHTFQFLTKNPYRYAEFLFSRNCWIGATATDQESYRTAKDGLMRAMSCNAGLEFVSFEPLLGPISLESRTGWKSAWIIIGAMTGPKAVKPDPGWVASLIEQAREHSIPVFVKDNVGWAHGSKEFPKQDTR